MKLPLMPEQLPTVDALVLDAVLIEHGQSATAMGRTLRGYGWSPVQVAFAEDKWSWSWIARAVVGERAKRGQEPVNHAALDVVQRAQPDAVAVRAEAAWVAEHGEVEPPRPPVAVGAPGAPIRLPTRSDASGYALSPVEPESRGERL